MPISELVFDLDGTLSDPIEGIANSINDALEQHGFAPASRDAVSQLIGPPMDQIFESLTGRSESQVIADLIRTYRERYSAIGYSENRKYEGIDEVLEKLSGQNCRMGICTSKRTDFARKIVDMFDWTNIFSFVKGGDVGISKADELRELLTDEIITPGAIMIGDRAVDILAAKAVGLRSAGVLWGHGSQEELAQVNPEWILHTPGEILDLVDQLRS